MAGEPRPANVRQRRLRAPLLWVAVVVCAAELVASRGARALDARFHADLVAANQRVDQARGPEVYAALRAVWDTWDRADPTHVEEALLATERSQRLAPPARVYSGLLTAFARIRRGDVGAARSKIRSLGYVDHWLVVGPFDNEGKAGLMQQFGPELEFAEPIVPGRAYSGKERPVRWRKAPDVFPHGWIDLGSLLRPDTKICAYLTSYVRDKNPKAARRKISAWVGSAGAFQLFWNGDKVLEDTGYRRHDFDRFATLVDLEPGLNTLSVKVCGDDASPVASVRLGDARGGTVADVVVSSEFTDSEAAAAKVKELRAKRAKSHGAGKAATASNAAPDKQPSPTAPLALEGPMQTFERLTAAKDPKPEVLYAYADYLASTGGDDPTVHKARDLASRAAERAPTIDRLLLAARLAEDRNQEGEWLKKAAELAAKDKRPNVDFLLAQASHASSSPNWRDAFPFIDKVLAVDPGNVEAIRSRVQLENGAGLKRSALATIQHAIELTPNSVALLGMYAAQLSALGRETASAEVEDRYLAYRFDDRTLLGRRVDLSLARHDQQAAERWVSRLLEADPDSQWALGQAATAYRRMGQSQRAVATLERAMQIAPEDVGTLRALADLVGSLGNRDRQLALLRDLLRLQPQERQVREYLDHMVAPGPRPDEAYAWDAKRFLKLRNAPGAGFNRRTLRDLTVTTVFDNGLSSKFRQIVFQPLTDAAAAFSRQYAFSYEADQQQVQLRGARIYRSNGRVDEATEWGEAAADDPSIAMYTSSRNFYIQLPRLEPGDVVELLYRIDDTTPRNPFNDYFGDLEYLQSSEPVSNAEYVLITPKTKKLYIDQKVRGIRLETKDIDHQRVYRFWADEIPPLLAEPSMPPPTEVLGFVHVSTYRTYKDLGRWYWGMVKDQFDLDDETRKLAHKVADGKTSEIDKVKAVYDWVVTNTRYVALEFGIYGYKPHRCVQTVARGWGDCKDKATVIVTLLKELGIPSTIVVLRSQLRGDFHSELPSFAPFDHAIVYVPSLDMYLDGTAEFTGSTELPAMDQEALGLRINQGDAELVHLPKADPAKNVERREVHASVEPGGVARLDLSYTTTGNTAADWRRKYHAEATRRDRINTDIGSQFPGFEIAAGAAGIQTNDLENIEEPVKLDVHGSAPSFARHEGNQLSMAVTLPAAGGSSLTAAFASLSERKQDVRMLGFSNLDDTFTVKLPAGYKVVTAPEDASIDGPFGSFSLKTERQPGSFTLRARLGLKVTRVSPKEYPAWRRFCGEVDRALSPRLVIGQ